MSGFELYWLLMLDSICATLTGILVICVIFFLAYGFFGAMFIDETYHDSKSDEWKKYHKRLRITFIIGICVLVINTFIPNTKQMAAIIVAPAIINNKQVQELPKKLLDVLGLSADVLKKELKKASQ